LSESTVILNNPSQGFEVLMNHPEEMHQLIHSDNHLIPDLFGYT